MIALKCSRCGHEREVSAAERERDSFCPKCGQTVPGVPSSDGSQTVSSKPPSGITKPGSRPDSVTPNQSDNDETVSAHSSKKVEEFSFLSPAQGPEDMGWLAHYQVVRELGQGGMGIVFEALDTQLQRAVALKVMKPDIAKDDLARQRFLREARATASVKSDYIVMIHQVSEHNKVPYLAMELLQGEPLDRWIEQHGRPTLDETVRIGIEISRGLATAHERGLIHRDIKPGNIWLETVDSGQQAAGTRQPAASSKHSNLLPATRRLPPAAFRVKILDFGLARSSSEKANLTQAGLVLGTPAYMAPEQAEGGTVDARSDLFSLGCVLYELATGQVPFSGVNTMAVLMAVAMKDPKPPLALNADLPPALSDLIVRLLAKNPKERPATARDVAAALEEIAQDRGLSGITPSSGFTSARTRQGAARGQTPRRRWIVAVALAGLVVFGALSWFAYTHFANRDGEILLGMSGPFSGPSKELGREMELGIKTYIKHINDEGGVHGRKLKLIPLDDRYEPDDALANMKKFHDEYKVFAVIGNIGTPTAVKTLPYAIENKMLFFGAFTGAKILRKDPPDRYIFNYRASYEEETAAIVNYLIRKRNILPDQIAVFAQNDGYGDAGFRGVVKALGKDPTKILRVGYERNTSHVQEAVDEILKHPEIRAVVMVPTYNPARAFIQKLTDAKRDLIFTNVSFVGTGALAEGLQDIGVDGVIVTQVVPPIDSGATVVVKYRELLGKFYPNERPSFSSLEGYIATTLFVDGLKRAGANPTPEKVIDAFESIQNLDLGTGAPLSFGPSRHQASNKVWAIEIDKKGSLKVLDMD